MQIQRELLTPALQEEMLALYQDYYSKTEVGADSPPLNFRWDVYQQVQDAGAFYLYTAREDGRLLGVSFYMVAPHLHHSTQIVASCCGLSVHLDARGKSVARKLIDFAAADLKAAGAHMMTHAARTCYKETPIFERLPEFRLREKTYSRDLT